MPDLDRIEQSEFRTAFHLREQEERVDTGKVASALVVFLMPAGVVLDYVVVSNFEHRMMFLALRLICSVLAGILWFLHSTRFGQKHYKLLGPPIALLPAFFISCMICVDAQARASYY